MLCLCVVCLFVIQTVAVLVIWMGNMCKWSLMINNTLLCSDRAVSSQLGMCVRYYPRRCLTHLQRRMQSFSTLDIKTQRLIAINYFSLSPLLCPEDMQTYVHKGFVYKGSRVVVFYITSRLEINISAEFHTVQMFGRLSFILEKWCGCKWWICVILQIERKRIWLRCICLTRQRL